MRQEDVTMNIPYRTRRALSRAAVVALVIALVATLVFACWFLWLKRYVVYTREEGAVLDMNLSAQIAAGEAAVPPEQQETVSIYYNEGDNAINVSKELTQLIGYYADAEALQDIPQVREQAKLLTADTAVMLDVKSARGNFFYSSSVSTNRDSKVDTEAMDALIAELAQSGKYLIARLPALRDRDYGLNNVPDGVFDSRGAYLFQDDGGCYWLNPARQGTVTHLVQIVTELKALGFDEVVFDDFCFPDTQYMKFDGDKAEALAAAAKTLVTTCAGDSFAVSFVQGADFALPEGRSRLYLEDAVAADAAAIAQQTGLENPEIRLVFLTQIHDTRFDAYGVLRPLDAAH